MTVRVTVTGAAGRMGRRLVAGVIEDPALDLAGATVRPGCDHLGQDAGLLGGAGAVGVSTVADRGVAFASAEVVVSFTPPDACVDDALAAREAGIPLVVGSTGWDGETRARLEDVCKDIAVVTAPNFSVGIWVLTRLVSDAAALLADFDVELFELHHKHKADAPSGTALLLAEAAANARSTTLGDSGVFTRHGRTGSRPDGVIGLQSLRGGDSTGEHTVMLLGEGERLELTHRTSSRAAFVSGALRSAKWVVDRPAGLYSLADVLGN